MQGDIPGGPIRWRMHIPAAPERVYIALDTNEGRASFWAESAEEVDGFIEFVFANGYRYKARIVERVPSRVYALEYFEGVARFELASAGKTATDLFLSHSGVSAAQWNDVHAGWLNVLFPLKAKLAFGVDLRNHDSERTWDHGYADQ